MNTSHFSRPNGSIVHNQYHRLQQCMISCKRVAARVRSFFSIRRFVTSILVMAFATEPCSADGCNPCGYQTQSAYNLGGCSGLYAKLYWSTNGCCSVDFTSVTAVMKSGVYTNGMPAGYCTLSILNAGGASMTMKLTLQNDTGPGDAITVTVSGSWEVGTTWYSGVITTFTVYVNGGDKCQNCSANGATGYSSGGGPTAFPLGAGSVANDQGPHISFPLGAGAYGQSAGYISLNAQYTTANLASPNALTLPMVPMGNTVNMTVVTNTNGVLQQVNVPQGLVNIVLITNGYEMQMFTSNYVTGPTNGLFGTNGSAFDTWTVTNPNGDTNTLFISETAGQTRTLTPKQMPGTARFGH